MHEGIAASQAKVLLNVRVVVGKPDKNGRIQVRRDKKFKNTATRLMTESICNYITGAENTYKRGKGRPNYMGIGTMGILKQPTANNPKAIVEDDFENKEYVKGESTRPWFQSTSLALTDVRGPKNPDERGISQHFWDAEKGWGKNGFTGDVGQEPIFQGELCTSRLPNQDSYPEDQDGWDLIERIPILRSDVLSDCPVDWDFGVDGYSSQAVFYGYAPVKLVHNLLNPTKRVWHPDPDPEKAAQHKGTWETVQVGPQLNVMAISEFGLYEKNNTDPHGLETMLAGFRVPTEDDIIYVSDGEVILIEWRVTVRALMPNEGVRITGEPAPTGIAVLATYLGETPSRDKQVQVTGVVKGDPGVRQGIIWTLDNADEAAAGTNLSANGLLTVDKNEKLDVLYVSGTSVVDPFITSRTAIITGILKNFVTGITLTTESITSFDIQFRATVLGRGTFSQDVTWKFGDQKPDKPTTTISSTGLLHMDFEETADKFQIIATSVDDADVFSVAAVVRIDKTAGTYVISDFTILTEGGE